MAKQTSSTFSQWVWKRICCISDIPYVYLFLNSSVKSPLIVHDIFLSGNTLDLFPFSPLRTKLLVSNIHMQSNLITLSQLNAVK